jgi:hypothetical protein
MFFDILILFTKQKESNSLMGKVYPIGKCLMSKNRQEQVEDELTVFRNHSGICKMTKFTVRMPIPHQGLVQHNFIHNLI